MDPRIFFTIFGTVLFAELGDKTQLATLLFAAEAPNSKLTVFLASASALVLSSAIAVLVGNILGKYVDPKHLSWIAGIGFVIIGIWTIAKA